MRNSTQPAQAHKPGQEQETAQTLTGLYFTLEPVEALTQPTEAAQSHARQQGGGIIHSRKKDHRKQEKPRTVWPGAGASLPTAHPQQHRATFFTGGGSFVWVYRKGGEQYKIGFLWLLRFEKLCWYMIGLGQWDANSFSSIYPQDKAQGDKAIAGVYIIHPESFWIVHTHSLPLVLSWVKDSKGKQLHRQDKGSRTIQSKEP